ncbi:MAG TPA: hypothetical protein VEU97_06585 [Ktedonobacteraceae bacterium]|nr:hypothetical protein [Ktedonobacteraceae bacterium]
MRWAVEYTLASGTIGLMIFSAADETAAQEYVDDMVKKYGHTNVFNLTPLPSGAGIDELYRLFPRQQTSNGEMEYQPGNTANLIKHG